jgi:hypothetical protein
MSRAGNTLEGAGTGALYGGTVGSVIPGIGTVGGAVIGGVGGGLYGYFKNKSLADVLGGSGTNVSGLLSGPESAVRDQENMVGSVENWGLRGTGPSAAQAMLASQRAAATQQALAQSKSMAGGNPALQATLASNVGAANEQNALNQASQLRAQEQQNMLKMGLEGRNQVTQNEQGISNAAMQGDMENSKRKSQFLGGLTSGLTGGIGGIL